MRSRREHFETMAALFTYPQPDYAGAVERARTCSGLAAPALRTFASAVRAMSHITLQELYTNTFDLQPACSLDLGWHLFGDDYWRGLLLARLRREMATHGILETVELPDHLSHALRLLASMEDMEAGDFARAIATPALERMLKCLPPENTFWSLLEAVQQLITTHFAELQADLSSTEALGAMS